MEDLISVIVPVYNVEAYLIECLQSIQNQTYSNLEIIVIDDGSTDTSGQICDEFALRDKRFQVYHQKNAGLSAARNAGLNLCKGQYICFIDSDDTIVDCFIERLYQMCAGNQSAIAICNIKSDTYGSSKPKGYIEKWQLPQNGHTHLNVWEAKAWLHETLSKDHGVMVVAMNKMYGRSLWEKLRYPEGMLHEDLFVIYSLLEGADDIIFTNEQLYCLRSREDSITGASNQMDERHVHLLRAYQMYLEHMVKQEIDENTRNEIEMTWRNYLSKSLYFQRIFQEGNPKLVQALQKEYWQVFHKYKKYARVKRVIRYAIIGITNRK